MSISQIVSTLIVTWPKHLLIFFSGTYNIFIKQGNQDVKVGCCENKGSFGELALMYNMPRAATIQSAGDGMLWAMDRQTFRRIVLRNAFQKRKMYEALLEKVPLLSSLNVRFYGTYSFRYIDLLRFDTSSSFSIFLQPLLTFSFPP